MELVKDQIWLTSDTHFGDDRCRHGRHRPFDTVEDMDEAIVANWNALVGEQDIVLHLGDFAVTDEAVEQFVPRLNGQIHLTCGNYEDTRAAGLLEEHFASVNRGPHEWAPSAWWVPVEDQVPGAAIERGIHKSFPIWLCHYPVQRHETLYTVTGHIHELWRVAKDMVNVGVDSWHFRPVPLEWIIDYQFRQEVGHWDGNVYPDAPLAWRLSQSTKKQRWEGEPTLDILRAEASRQRH